MITITRCSQSDIEGVMAFIDSHWKKGHVLASSRRLMDWQHGCTDGTYDYLIAKSDEKILGVLGYISSRRFDQALSSSNIIWLALWKVANDARVAGLGLRMLDLLSRVEPHVAIAVNGINFDHPSMYKALRYEVGELRQYFVTSPDLIQTIISAPSGYKFPLPKGSGTLMDELYADDLLNMDPLTFDSIVIGKKTPKYFLNRFLNHPVYTYRVFKITAKSAESCIIATRVAECKKGRLLRIVDFSGAPSAFSTIGQGLAKIMSQCGAQYADFWSYGMEEEFINPTGMIPVDPNGPTVVPNYFEPFTEQNGRILCAFKKCDNHGLPILVFRADGDQDRPNIISVESSSL